MWVVFSLIGAAIVLAIPLSLILIPLAQYFLKRKNSYQQNEDLRKYLWIIFAVAAAMMIISFVAFGRGGKFTF